MCSALLSIFARTLVSEVTLWERPQQSIFAFYSNITLPFRSFIHSSIHSTCALNLSISLFRLSLLRFNESVFPFFFSAVYFYMCVKKEICLAFVGKFIVNAPDNFTNSIEMGRLHVCFHAVAGAGATTAAVALAVYVYGFDSNSDVWKPRLFTWMFLCCCYCCCCCYY